jgi:osmoprotectant transport system substrate-binding protein
VRRASLLLSLLAALLLAACGSSGGGSSATTAAGQPGKGKPAVTLGDKNFTEQFILGQLYKQALEAKGYKVNLKSNIGSSEITDKALTSGKVDLYPEYTGVIVQELKGATKLPRTAAGTYAAALAFQAGRGLVLLRPTPFEDKDALAATKTYAQKHGLTSVADLSKLNNKFSIGAPPEFRTRFAGLKGLKQVYGLSGFTFKPLTIGLQYTALNQGKIDLANVFTTDGALQSGKYTVLSDPKGVFGFQNAAPVVSKKVLAREGPAFAATLNAVSAKLTTPAMRKMNAAVDINKQNPADVAKTFLQANGLLRKSSSSSSGY